MNEKTNIIEHEKMIIAIRKVMAYSIIQQDTIMLLKRRIETLEIEKENVL